MQGSGIPFAGEVISPASRSPVVIVANAGGGMAPHFRLQVQHQAQAAWRKYRVYQDEATANSARDELLRQGRKVRLLRYLATPCGA